MIYLLAGKYSLKAHPLFFGCMTAPHGLGLPLPVKEGRLFAVDNECFTRPFDPLRMQAHLQRLAPYLNRCAFVTVPDIPWHNGQRVFEAQITLEMFEEYANHIIFRGWPLAYVAQNGAESLPIPTEATAVFIGGDTTWKESDAALSVIKRAQARGMWVHVGRVNTKARLTHFRLARVDSVDGTGVTFAPKRVMAELTRWLSQPVLFQM
jgi:hypothetical protein